MGMGMKLGICNQDDIKTGTLYCVLPPSLAQTRTLRWSWGTLERKGRLTSMLTSSGWGTRACTCVHVCVHVCVCVRVCEDGMERLLGTCSYISVFHKTAYASKKGSAIHFVHALEPGQTINNFTMWPFIFQLFLLSQGYGGQEKSYIATQGLHTVMVVSTIWFDPWPLTFDLSSRSYSRDDTWLLANGVGI